MNVKIIIQVIMVQIVQMEQKEEAKAVIIKHQP